jgi:hypothetical protein
MFLLTQTREFINVHSLQHVSFSYVTQFIVSLKLHKSLSTAARPCSPCYWLVLMCLVTECSQFVLSLLEFPMHAHMHACVHTHTHTRLPSSSGKKKEREGCSNYSGSLTATTALGGWSVDIISVWQYENLENQLQNWI